MPTYLVTIGNTEVRKGHRHDCAQVSVTFAVQARSPEHARERVASGDVGVDWVSSVTVNPNTIGTALVKEMGS